MNKYIIGTLAALVFGCNVNHSDMYDLLHEEPPPIYKNYVYKSVTEKDYNPPEETAFHTGCIHGLPVSQYICAVYHRPN